MTARLARLGAILCDVAAFAVPAGLFIATASHEPASWDTAEFQGVPYILGISHPTGFPFFVLLGYVWSHVVAAGTIAFRMNAFSAVAMAGAATTAYAVALELGAARFVALPATWWYAFTQDVWSHSNRAEAQDLAVACEALAIYAFVRWLKGGSDAWFAGAFALYGLGIAAHPNALWLLPALVAGAIVVRRRPPGRLVAASVALAALGISLYLYLPIRSAYIVAHGLDPTLSLSTDGGIFWNYHNPSTPGGLWLDLTGSESQTPRYFLSSLNPVHVQDALWAFIQGIGEQYGAFVLLLSFAGVIAAWKRDWRVTLFLCLACTVALLFSVTYTAEGDIGRYRLMALWLAVPLVASLVPRDATGLRWGIARVALAIFLASGTANALANGGEYFEHAPGEGGRWVISAVKPYTQPGSIIMVDWLDATSLAYGAYVDGSLPGRIIVSGWNPDNMALYERWARRHPTYVLVNPHDVDEIPGARVVAHLDDYHDLYRVIRR